MDRPGRPREPDAASDGPGHTGVFAPEPLTRDHPPVRRWFAVAVIVLAVVVAKPWDWGATSTPTAPPSVAGAGLASPSPAAATPTAITPIATPIPTIRPDSAGPEVAAFCLDPTIWLVATVEMYHDQAIRHWRAVDPIGAATSLTDPRIPTVTIVSEGVLELGWCAPVVGDGRPASDGTATIWAIGPNGATQVAASAARPDSPSRFGALYDPPAPTTGPAPVDAAWPDGRFVFRYDAGSMQRWFAVELERRTLPGPS